MQIIEHDRFFEPGEDSALIPFYSTDPVQIEAFYRFVDQFRKFNQLNVVVVNDGTSGLDINRVNTGLVINHEDGLNHGKAEAIRLGLSIMLDSDRYRASYIVQYNGDSDQSYLEPPKLLAHLKEMCPNPNQPGLVIGERYSAKLETPPNPASISYRQSILILQKALAASWGYSVSDWVSGSRAFTSSYAKRLLDLSVSQYYGIEAEELTIAYLVGAKVGIEPLKVSRPRDPDTQAGKLLQSLHAILSHKQLLEENGQTEVVNLLEEVRRNITDRVDFFTTDLNSIGVDAIIEWRKTGNGYATTLPQEVVDQYFDTSVHPFAFRQAV